MMQATLLVTLLSIPLLAASSPALQFFGVHPATPVMFAAYAYGIHLVSQARSKRLWQPRQTPETREDAPDNTDTSQQSLVGLWLRFAVLAAIIAIAGWVIARSAVVIAVRTGLSETVVGSIFTAVSTSLPELVTSIAAVRQGALALAVGGIVGGNAFDTLFLAISGIAYREGSIYHAITERQIFLIALTVLLIGILLMGLVRREKRGIFNIGFESFLVLAIYVGAMLFVCFG